MTLASGGCGLASTGSSRTLAAVGFESDRTVRGRRLRGRAMGRTLFRLLLLLQDSGVVSFDTFDLYISRRVFLETTPFLCVTKGLALRAHQIISPQ